VRVALVIAAAVAALAGAPAAYAYPPWVLAIRDCADDGKLDHTYSHGALTEALHNVPSDGGEYSDCANELRHALTGGSGKTDGPRVNGVLAPSGAIAATDDDLAQLQRIVAAVDVQATTPPIVVVTPTPSPATDVALADLGDGTPPYRPDVALLLLVGAGGALALISASAAGRARRRAAA
jgi:hypothetical protein